MMHVEMVLYYDQHVGVDLSWCSLDSATVKAPRGDLTGPSPTDRAELGTKRHILTDADGVPLAVTITGANVLRQVDGRPDPRCHGPAGPSWSTSPADLCLDKGFDYADCEQEVRRRRIVLDVRRRGEPPLVGCVHGRPRRWVVERTDGWHNDIEVFSFAGNAKPRIT